MACSDSCDEVPCGERNTCGNRCFDRCWVQLQASAPLPLPEEPCPEGVDVTEGELTAPGAREDACLAFDAGSQRFLLFGGDRVQRYLDPVANCRPDGTCDDRRTCGLGDTWTFAVDPAGDVKFQRESPERAPSPRAEATCVATPDGVLLFGGQRVNSDEWNVSWHGILPEELWRWKDGAWTTTEGQTLGLGQISRAPAAWDPDKGELVVVGGCQDGAARLERICSGVPDGPLTCVPAEQIETNGFPWPYAASMAWDPIGRRMLIVGGGIAPVGGVAGACGAPSRGSDETWALVRTGAAGERWAFRSLGSGPIFAAETASLAGGEADVLRFGGIDRDDSVTENQDESCLWDGAQWTCLTNLSTERGGPARRDQSSIAYGAGGYVVFGGSSSSGLSLGDLWRFVPPARN